MKYLRIFALAGLALMPIASSPWGTLIAPKVLTESDIGNLEYICEKFGSAALKAQVRERLGPHATHQFIVQQAYKLLDKDPAYSDGDSGLPTAEQVNAWDGIVIADHGPVQRPVGASYAGIPAVLGAPTTSELNGPSPDAELLADSATTNSEYQGAAHYWNPWLESGEAPTAAAKYFTALLHSVLDAGTISEKAHYACYLSHYTADVSCAKHADCVELTDKDVVELEKLAGTWAAKISSDYDGWLRAPEIQSALKIVQDRANACGSQGAAWWKRIQKHVTDCILTPGSDVWMFVYRPTMESAIGAYLWELNHRGTKSRMAFFGYFDPLYYNGPIYQPRGWQNPSFKIAEAMSSHLVWETDLRQFRDTALPTIAADKALLDQPNSTYYSDVRPSAPYYDLDDTAADAARTQYLSDLEKASSVLVHGATVTDDEGFGDFMPYMSNAIRHVYVALRSSISAMRVSAKYAATGTKGEYVLRLSITNLADEPVELGAFRILTFKDGKFVAPAGWQFPAIGGSLAKGVSKDVKVKLQDVPKPETGDPIFIPEVHGKYGKTPDSGVRRCQAVPGGNVEMIENPESAGEVSTTTGPLDLAICFDVTGSMQSSIDSMRAKAIEIVKTLNKQSPDMRLALCAFRDQDADGPEKAFELHPFSKEIEGYIGTMGGWVADGGGDTPEDQLEAIHRILELWKKEKAGDRSPTKVVIVITDAPAHEPDTFGNSYESIAKLAMEVDPAHIYPVVVGTDADAVKDATRLAKDTSGKVTTSADYASAADKLLEVVKTAVREHPAPPQGMSRRTKMNLLLFGGGGVFILGIGSFLIGSRMRRRHRRLVNPT